MSPASATSFDKTQIQKAAQVEITWENTRGCQVYPSDAPTVNEQWELVAETTEGYVLNSQALIHKWCLILGLWWWRGYNPISNNLAVKRLCHQGSF